MKPRKHVVLGPNLSIARPTKKPCTPPTIPLIERAIETEAGVVATACPFCLQMFEDAAKAKGVEESLKVMDIAELLVESVMH